MVIFGYFLLSYSILEAVVKKESMESSDDHIDRVPSLSAAMKNIESFFIATTSI